MKATVALTRAADDAARSAARLLALGYGSVVAPATRVVATRAEIPRGDHDAVGQSAVERPIRRLEMEFEAALVAPALQFDHPVALANRVTFQQRQSAGLGEQIHQHHRLVVDLEAVSRDHIAKHLVADIGPWRRQRKIVIDPTRHAGSVG